MIRPFDAQSGMSLPDLPEPAWLWLGKAVGAVLGSAISLAYVLPRSSREAFIRFVTGVIIGLAFGSLAGARIVRYLDIAADLSRMEIVLMGSTAASLCAWWILGILHRLARRHGAGSGGDGNHADDGGAR